MSRKFTAALFENVDYKAQAADLARREEEEAREKKEEGESRQKNKGAGFFSRLIGAAQSRLDWPRVVLFGDSLTQYSFGDDGGWGAMLADKLQRRADVVNRGFSGYNTRWSKIILEQVFQDERPETLACVVVLLGSNDAADAELAAHTHVPLTEYSDNLRSILSDLQNEFRVDKEKIVLVTPPPVNRKLLEEDREQSLADGKTVFPLAHHNASVGRYAEACRRVGHETGVHTLDLFSLMLAQDDWAFFFCDGIHFSRRGSEFFLQFLWPIVEAKFEGAPFKFSHWRHVNRENPAVTLEKADVFDPDFQLD